MLNITNKKIFAFLLVITGLVALGFGILIGETSVTRRVCPPEKVNFSLFWEAWDMLSKKYVNPEKLDTQKMIYGAISGLANSLEDPYTVFLNPEDSKKFKEDTAGHFEGVGMEVGIRKGFLQVIAPIKGTPAQQAGLRPGDKIIKINDTLTADLTLDKAVSLIRGPRGTKVTLTIFRDDWNDTKEFVIERAVIDVPSLEWELKDGGVGGKIAYIKLYQFSENANADFSKAAREILDSPAEKIILDLRNNPGGYLEVAQDIAGWFLEGGGIVTIEVKGNGDKIEYRARGNARLFPYPTVILMNQGSASGSEILAGALRDNRNIKLVGETSFGKGSVQQLEEMTGGSSLKITVAKWLTPKGVSINEVGLEPDIKIEMADEDYEKNQDPQLDRAIEVIKEIR